MKSRHLLVASIALLVAVIPCSRAEVYSLEWLSNPGNVETGQSYYISAQAQFAIRGYYSWPVDIALVLYRDGEYVDENSTNNYDYCLALGSYFTETSPGQVDYEAYAYDYEYGEDWIYHSVTVTSPAANSAPTQVTISTPAATIRQGESLSLSSTAIDPDGNMNLHSFWRRGPRNADTFGGDWDGWVRDADNLAGWSSFSTGTAGMPGSGSNSQISAVFTPPSPGYWQFQANARDSQDAWHAGVTTPAVFVAPLPALNFAASTAGGQVGAGGGGSLTLYLGEAVTLSSTAAASGWLSEHNFYGYTPGPALFSISGGTATLSATATTTLSARTVTWTPSSAGTHTLYAEAFTGTSPGNRLHGVSGWVQYAGGPFGGLADKRVTVNVRRNPAGSLQLLNAQSNPLSLQNGIYALVEGDVFYLKISGSDADGDAVRYASRFMRPDGTLILSQEEDRDTGDGYSGSRTFGPFTANAGGDWQVWGHVIDATARAWDSITPWNENANGYYSSPHYTMRVQVNLAGLNASGIPKGLAQDGNNNGIPDLVEAALGLTPSGTNNTIPANITREYQYNEVNELIQSPERGYQLDAEGNIKNK
ncbi:MAG: hypothetical protein LBC18_06355 [Opitutaceae bacterium]|jgi:hypothetical protein|nr:hypothetical protein [Opitutaceae bacterium]